MNEFLTFIYSLIAGVWLFIFLFTSLKKRFFTPFIEASMQRITIWNRIKTVIVSVVALFLLFKGIERLHYSHDEIACTDKKFLDMAYADQVEVEVYLMDQEKLIHLFKGNPPEHGIYNPSKPMDLSCAKTSDPFFYLVIRIKNKGNRTIWGSLEWGPLVNYFQKEYMPQVDIPPLPPNMADFTNVVLWSEVEALARLPSFYPNLKTKWVQLYTCEGKKT
jgi:hypothetical protein